MELKIKRDFRGLKAGSVIPITYGEVNYWMGGNGTGKSTATQLLYSLLVERFPKLERQEYWNAALSDNSTTISAECEFPPIISSIFISSDKLRQSQSIDIGVSSKLGIGRLGASEGMNSSADLQEMFEKANSLSLNILDETDGHLDTYSKHIFFDYLLPRLKGTTILVSHDAFHLSTKSVFDFTDYKFRTGREVLENAWSKAEEKFGKLGKQNNE